MQPKALQNVAQSIYSASAPPPPHPCLALSQCSVDKHTLDLPLHWSSCLRCCLHLECSTHCLLISLPPPSLLEPECPLCPTREFTGVSILPLRTPTHGRPQGAPPLCLRPPLEGGWPKVMLLPSAARCRVAS